MSVDSGHAVLRLGVALSGSGGTIKILVAEASLGTNLRNALPHSAGSNNSDIFYRLNFQCIRVEVLKFEVSTCLIFIHIIAWNCRKKRISFSENNRKSLI